MSAFREAWLRLREPLDAASRATELVAALARLIPERPLRVIDLATGTGANLRYLSPRLGGRQDWQLIDHDRALLEAIPERLDRWARSSGARMDSEGATLRIGGADFDCRARRLCRDLARELEAIDFGQAALITGSALLDLVSASWLDALARRCADAGAAVLFALTYDGRVQLDPREPDDDAVIALVNRHQRTDKGFGPALGPAAGSHAAAAFERLGYRVETAQSDWHIGPDAHELHEALLAGWLEAATEIAPDEAPRLMDWAGRRRAHVAAGRATLVVGHVDLLGQPPATK